MSEVKPQNSEQRSSRKEVFKLTSLTAFVTASLAVGLEALIEFTVWQPEFWLEEVLLLVIAIGAGYFCGAFYKYYLHKQKVKIAFVDLGCMHLMESDLLDQEHMLDCISRYKESNITVKQCNKILDEQLTGIIELTDDAAINLMTKIRTAEDEATQALNDIFDAVSSTSKTTDLYREKLAENRTSANELSEFLKNPSQCQP